MYVYMYVYCTCVYKYKPYEFTVKIFDSMSLINNKELPFFISQEFIVIHTYSIGCHNHGVNMRLTLLFAMWKHLSKHLVSLILYTMI